jgi:zinc transporter ZupT
MEKGAQGKTTKARLLLLGLAPLAILGVVVAFFFVGGSIILSPLTTYNAPIESVSIDRVILHDGQIVLTVINTGPTEVTVAQVLVNDAIWDANISPSRTLSRLARATILIPYQWVEGEPIEVKLVTSNGFVFAGGVEAATFSPRLSPDQAAALALIGLYVGIIPVFLGLGWLPFINRVSDRWYNFLLSLTAGLLIFLAVDAWGETIELAGRTPATFQGLVIAVVTVSVTFLALESLGERALTKRVGAAGTKPSLLGLAYLVSLGIGLHNMGEGLLIGAAYGLGEVALGTFLILGFTIHNATEGFAIAAPLGSRRARLTDLIRLGLIAGAPTIAGSLIGGFVYSDLWGLVFLAVGIGAILQVLYELAAYITGGRSVLQALSELPNLAGLVVGFGLAYLTALMVA